MAKTGPCTALRHRVKRIGKTWFAQVADPETGKFPTTGWRSTYTRSRIEAERIGAERAAAELDGCRSTTSGQAQTLVEALCKLSAAMLTSWSPESLEIFKLKSRNLVTYFGPDFLLADLSPDAEPSGLDLTTGYLNDRVIDGEVTQATVAKELGYLCRVARDAGVIRKSKDIWPRALPHEFAGVTRALSLAEYMDVYRALEPREVEVREQSYGTGDTRHKRRTIIAYEHGRGVDFRDHFLVYTLCGLRFFELYRLTPRDLQGDMLHVPGTKTAKSDRYVCLQPDARIVLERRAAACKPGEPLFPITSKASNGTSARANQRRAWLRALGGACDRAGVDHASTNDLRRTFATWCRDSGVDEMTCVGWMGHADSKMVRTVYAQATVERQRIEAAKLPTFTAGRPERTITPMRREPPRDVALIN